jgi:DNA repair exonuclease SbcCD ATPase subunit
MKKIKIQRKKPKISYVGSTIMQNHSEAKYPDHGILVWDVYSKSSEFVPIHNDYGYVTVDVENGNLIGNPLIPNKPRMRVRVKDTTQSELKKILSKIRVGRKVEEVSIQKVLTDKKDVNGNSTVVIQNVRDVGFQNKLIEDYLTDRYVLSDEHLEVVRNINTDINTKLGTVVGMKHIVWKPKTFEFSNMFSYGPNNIIDFSQMNGAYGIFAANASGKSSLWDALTFCIYDKCSRTSKAIDVMNYSKNSFNCKFNFEIDGVDYFIERVGKKSSKRGTVKVDVSFYKINTDGDVESLNGDERRDTNSIIRQYVGSYDDFILTAMSNQSNNSGFIEKSQKERKELLAQFLDMDVFEELYQVANEELKEISTLLKDYKNQNFTEKLSEAEDSLVKNKKILSDTQLLIDEYRQRKTKVGIQIEQLISKLISVDTTIIDTDLLITKKSNLEIQLNNKSVECGGYSDTLADLTSKLKDCKTEFNKYDLNDLREHHVKYESYADMMVQINSQIDDLDRDIKHKQKHLDGIGSLTFDDGCEHCVANKNTPFAQQAQSLESEIKKLALIRLTRSGELDNASMGKARHDVTTILAEVQILKNKITEYTSKIEKIELQNKACNLELSELENKIEKIESDIKKSAEQKESVDHNTKIQIEIDKYKQNLKEIEDLISDTNDTLIDVSGDVRIAENTINTVNASIEKLELMERKYEGYEYYLQCVKRDGIPYELISDVLPKLEVEINNILQPLVEFQVLLNTDGKNINSYIAYGDEEYWPLELTSGMEKFISSVAIRTALISVSNLPRPNFIAIDEGFGSLDSDNFNSLYLLFDYLKSQFDFIVTISHIDKTRDMVDQIIDITKVGGFSSIRYL